MKEMYVQYHYLSIGIMKWNMRIKFGNERRFYDTHPYNRLEIVSMDDKIGGKCYYVILFYKDKNTLTEKFDESEIDQVKKIIWS